MIPRPIFALALASALLPGGLRAQTPPLSQPEPGLERAVNWKWQVEPSPAQTWGQTAPTPTPSPESPALPTAQMVTYTVKRGDALAIIARRFHTSVEQLKQVNGLTNNLIRIGQELTIPPPLPPPPPAPHGGPHAKPADNLETLTLQVFLDREQFSSGPINGQRTPAFERVRQLYQDAHADAHEPAALIQKAKRVVPEPLTTYTLAPEDFRFIAPPKAQPLEAKSSRKNAKAFSLPKPTYADLSAARMLAYRSPWEFVAERFHCDERYLRALNPQLPAVPPLGATFHVPNVIPFAIERSLLPPLQPAANPREPVTAAITNLSLLEISRGGRVVAAMPLSIARPGLRGKGSWAILDAIPRPTLETRREPLVKAAPPTRIFGRDTPTPTPAPTPIPPPEFLRPGPRNPVGILWINLAKDAASPPLPYGLTGTSIPDHMATHESLGGLRLVNWDIARAVRLLPVGTPLEWKDLAPAPMTAARPPQ
jgi:LysM repeat protein